MRKFIPSIVLASFFSFSVYAQVPQILIDTCNSHNAKTGHQCWRLATAYRNEKNNSKALDAFKKSCNAGYAMGCYEVGDAYFYGQLGVKQNNKKALSFYKKGCDLGDESNCVMIKEVEAEQ